MARPAQDLRGYYDDEDALQILRPTEKRYRGSVIWVCYCRWCDNEVELSARSIKRRKRVHCGCADGDLRPKTADTPVEKLRPSYSYLLHKHALPERGLAWDIPEETFMKLLAEPCEVCHHPSTDEERNLLERRDEGRGYTMGNVVVLCVECCIVAREFGVPRLLARARRIRGEE